MAKKKVKPDIAVVSPSPTDSELRIIYQKLGEIDRNIAQHVIDGNRKIETNWGLRGLRGQIGKIFPGTPKQIIREINKGVLKPHGIIVGDLSLSSADYGTLREMVKNGEIGEDTEPSKIRDLVVDLASGETGRPAPTKAIEELVAAFRKTRKKIGLIIVDSQPLPLGSVDAPSRDNPGGSVRRLHASDVVTEAAAKIKNGENIVSNDENKNWPNYYYEPWHLGLSRSCGSS